ncbi:MAG: biopolymer transporter ExbD [Deltaproteobacteria bacterium]|nr:biopolymer transporter ExbD [Deltaproteobacteria bacterium]
MSFDYQQQQQPARDELWHKKRQWKKRMRRGREEIAQPLAITSLMDAFFIILCFLLKSYASDPVNIQQSDILTLPESIAKEPLERAVVIAITSDAIVVDDVKVVGLRSGAVDPSNKRDGANGFFIEPLYQSLQNAMQKAKAMQQRNAQAVTSLGMAMILGDKRCSYRLLSEVLYTAGQAEFSRFKFAVVKTGKSAASSGDG